jgi:hypothetical protein
MSIMDPHIPSAHQSGAGASMPDTPGRLRGYFREVLGRNVARWPARIAYRRGWDQVQANSAELLRVRNIRHRGQLMAAVANGYLRMAFWFAWAAPIAALAGESSLRACSETFFNAYFSELGIPMCRPATTTTDRTQLFLWTRAAQERNFVNRGAIFELLSEMLTDGAAQMSALFLAHTEYECALAAGAA